MEQKLSALQEANRIRVKYARDKEFIRCRPTSEGLAECAEFIRQAEPCPRNATVFDLLCAVHRFGPQKARRVLLRAQVSEGRRIRELTERQRHLLADLIQPAADDGEERAA